MKAIKNLLTDIDLFGITISFRYNTRKKYQSPLGGFFLVLFLILLFVLGIYYFIPFFNRKNYTVVYYTMNLASTEEVDLFTSESNVAFGLTCESNSNEKLKISDLLDLQTKFIIYKKSMDGSYNKDPFDIDTHSCTYSDFFNKYDKQVDYLGLNKFQCMTNENYVIQGIYSDQIFSYFEISVLSKNTSIELLNEIERFLFENDCKLHMAFTDMIIDLDDYESPMTQYLNDELFIQLNPTLFIKKNIYFMNQEFTNDNYLLFIIEDDKTPEIKTLYSRYEEYNLWKGLNRGSTKPDYFNYFSKVYIRADLKKTVIKRKYQKFMEFFADTFSLLTGIYEVLYIIFYFIYNFSSYHFFSKRLFFFKELNNENNFNAHKKINQIENLLYIIDSKEKKDDNNLIEVNSNLNKGKIKNKEENQKEINIYNNNKKYSSKEVSELKYSSKSITSQRQNDEYSKQNFNENYQKYNMNLMRGNKIKNNERIYKSRSSDRYKIYSNESIGTNMDSSSESAKPKRKKRIDYSFNLFEIIFVLLCRCCLTKKIKLKNIIYDKANNIMFKKMDIITYVRNMILFDFINKIIIDEDRIPIINFICRPIISLNKEEKNKYDDFYKNYREKDFNQFSEEIMDLTEKPRDKDKKMRLVSLSREHLKKFV